MLQTHTEELNAGLTGRASPCFRHDPAARGSTEVLLQKKFAINEPGDRYEQEADRISDQVMRMAPTDIARTPPPAIQQLSSGLQKELLVKRLCIECEEETLHRATVPTGAGVGRDRGLRQADAKVDAVRGGQPLSNEQRAFFEPRFGVDFGRVRMHTDGSADTAARAVGALAYTRGCDIVFREGQYRPYSYAGRQLLAHELTHVVQQGAAPRIRHRSVNENGERHAQSNELHVRMANHVLQCWPGDGMLPPGDCSLANYLVLRGSVETAKAVVSTLGACSAGDNCLTLAAKIAAITAEIAARVALDTTCFKGGDTGHRRQVQDKVNMMNRCFQFFSDSNCPPELIAAMAVVVDRAREVIAEAAFVVAIASVVALIAAIIALWEVIAAAAAAAAEAAEIAAAAVAVIALLAMILDELSPEDSSGA
jgi:hypothetical protein